jgi:RNA polymerase sigma-70 factor (ECF subfamily)
MDRRALEDLVRRHEAYVRGLAARLAPRVAEADDLAQEAFLVALRRKDELDLDRDLRPWLAQVVRNLSRQAWDRALREDRLRRDGLAEYLEALDADPSGLFDEPSKAALRRCLEKLPERSRTLLNLRYNLGLRSEAISEKVGSRADAVRMALLRIRELLRECIDRTLGEARA